MTSVRLQVVGDSKIVLVSRTREIQYISLGGISLARGAFSLIKLKLVLLISYIL